MGTRPLTTSLVMSMTRSHSDSVRVGVSPVVPQGTRKSIPDATCHSTRDRNAASSTAPSFLNGVTSAVPHPRSCIRKGYRRAERWERIDLLQVLKYFPEVVKTLLSIDPLGSFDGAFGEAT